MLEKKETGSSSPHHHILILSLFSLSWLLPHFLSFRFSDSYSVSLRGKKPPPQQQGAEENTGGKRGANIGVSPSSSSSVSGVQFFSRFRHFHVCAHLYYNDAARGWERGREREEGKEGRILTSERKQRTSPLLLPPFDRGNFPCRQLLFPKFRHLSKLQ